MPRRRAKNASPPSAKAMEFVGPADASIGCGSPQVSERAVRTHRVRGAGLVGARLEANGVEDDLLRLAAPPWPVYHPRGLA